MPDEHENFEYMKEEEGKKLTFELPCHWNIQTSPGMLNHGPL